MSVALLLAAALDASAAMPPPPPPAVPASSFHLYAAVQGGFAYQWMLISSFFSGFVDARLGAQRSRIDLFGRLRVQAGATLNGLSFENISVGGGFSFHLGTRVRLGLSALYGPHLIQRFTSGETKPLSVVGLYPELSVEVWRRPQRPGALFLSASLGLETSIPDDGGGRRGPGAFVGLGYRIR